jgi:glycosyl transferase family 1
VDVLIVASSTTAGLRHAEAGLARALKELGLSVETVSSEYRLARRLHDRISHSLFLIDLFETAALRRAAARALRRIRPRALVFSTTHAAMLQPRRRTRGPVAIGFDSPAALSRTQGRLVKLEHLLERSRFRRATVLLPWGPELPEDVLAVLPPNTPAVPLPIPIDPGPGGRRPEAPRDPIAVAYGGSAAKKGLEVMVSAWNRAAPSGMRLLIAGIEPEAARSYLGRAGVAEPAAGIEWPGTLAPDDYRVLTSRAEIFLAASTYEDYGIAQLEALRDGALLVTTPSRGPFKALKLARELDERLVASEQDPEALARSLRAAAELGPEERRRYRARARELVAPYSDESLKEQLKERVLPLLRLSA